jgi:hypothetical protein
LFELLALRELAAVAFQRKGLALAFLVFGGKFPDHLGNDFATVEPQGAQVVEDHGR